MHPHPDPHKTYHTKFSPETQPLTDTTDAPPRGLQVPTPNTRHPGAPRSLHPRRPGLSVYTWLDKVTPHPTSRSRTLI